MMVVVPQEAQEFITIILIFIRFVLNLMSISNFKVHSKFIELHNGYYWIFHWAPISSVQSIGLNIKPERWHELSPPSQRVFKGLCPDLC